MPDSSALRIGDLLALRAEFEIAGGNDKLSSVESARKQADAFIVVGIMPGDRVFMSVDPRITIPDLNGILQRNIDFICQSEAHNRARRAKEEKSHG